MFVFGKQYGGGICQVYENDFHKNAAYLLILGKTEDITVTDSRGAHHVGRALLVKPMVEHKVVTNSSLACNFFLAPQSAFAKSLDQSACGNEILKLQPEALPFHSGMPNDEIFAILDKVMVESNAKLDPRLAQVLEYLNDAPLDSNIAALATRCNLSASRLRTLAKEQIGVSLSTLFLWRKLVKAMEVLTLGSTLSEAAQAGGFSDQAHFTRTMRKMFGITPSYSTYPLGY